MARNKRDKEVKDYRHDSSTRKNNPPAGIAGQARTPDTPKQEYAYNPHLPPILRSDPNGDVDKLHELLQKAQKQPLTPEEAKRIADALKHHEPWLEWNDGRVSEPRISRITRISRIKFCVVNVFA